jgi:phytoene/squalene synthetase
MKELFDKVSANCSKLTTNKYSTSFSLGIRFLAAKFHDPIYGIYGFVRFADEIVDSFHGYNKAGLLEKFKADAYEAIESGISLNPILNSFQKVVNTYGIEKEIIDTFLNSMKMDLEQSTHDIKSYDKYVLGSAEVVGLMCLRVFCEGDIKLYEMLKPYGMKLGSAFQKINFLRDMKADSLELGRMYFPGINFNEFKEENKSIIQQQIQEELYEGLKGIRKLPPSSRAGVYLAYYYYSALFNKIKSLPAGRIANERIRISNPHKFKLMLDSIINYKLNRI